MKNTFSLILVLATANFQARSATDLCIEVYNQISTFSIKVDTKTQATVFNWNTNTELAVDFYTIEQRVNDTTIVEVASIVAQGFALQHVNYTTSIDSVIKGVTQYRVKLTDVYGDIITTPWQMVFEQSEFTMEYYYPDETIAPRVEPVQNKSVTQFVITDSDGNIIYKEEKNGPSQMVKNWIPAGQLYFKVLYNDEEIIKGNAVKYNQRKF